MGCDSSQNFDVEKKNIITKGDAINDDSDEDNKIGNKENKDNRRNKKDQRKKRDMKNQREFRMSEDDDYFSNSDSYKQSKKEKKKLRSSKKKRDDSEKSEEEEDNKEENSNQNTEGMATVETRKLNFKKKENEGLLIMDGIEELIPEDLTEDDIYQLVEDALGDNIVENEGEKIPGTITRKQAKSVASVL